MTVLMYSKQPSENDLHQCRTVRGQLYIQIEYVLKIITSQGEASSESAAYCYFLTILLSLFWIPGSVIPKEVKSSSYRLMIAMWLLSMVVLINAYIGIYTAQLALHRREPTVNTLEELASSNKFKMTIDYHSDLAYKSLVSSIIYTRNIHIF